VQWLAHPSGIIKGSRCFIEHCEVLVGSSNRLKHDLLTYLLPGMPLTCRAATKVLHFCLSLAIFSSMIYISRIACFTIEL